MSAAREMKATPSEVQAGRPLGQLHRYLWEASKCFIACVTGRRASWSGNRVKTFPLEQSWLLLCFCGFLQEGGRETFVLRRTARHHIHGQEGLSVARDGCSKWWEGRVSKRVWVLVPVWGLEGAHSASLAQRCIWVGWQRFGSSDNVTWAGMGSWNWQPPKGTWGPAWGLWAELLISVRESERWGLVCVLIDL